MTEEPHDNKAFATSFKRFIDQMSDEAESEPPLHQQRLAEHLGDSCPACPVVAERFEASDHANVHIALEHYLRHEGRSADILGIVAHHDYERPRLVRLLAGDHASAQDGPVEYTQVALDEGRFLAAYQSALLLIRDGEHALAVLIQGPSDHGWKREVYIEVAAQTAEPARAFLASVRSIMRDRNVYRGRIISLSRDQTGQTSVRFHRLPTIPREGIILPAGILERVERLTIRFAELALRLAAAGRHLRRGLLLYGPPGTGKTLTAMHLASRMPGRTVILLTGPAIGLIESSCRMARALAPATVIIEDADLIAEQRQRQDVCTNSVLFELLNQMDGLDEDADILFLLTTNRPELLEPALAARPGRIDQAVEVPLPDPDCRRRLLDLYGRGLTFQLSDDRQFVSRTEGVSAAFIKELVRRAALHALDETGPASSAPPAVNDRHLDRALHELLVEGGPLTGSLLGAARTTPTTPASA